MRSADVYTLLTGCRTIHRALHQRAYVKALIFSKRWRRILCVEGRLQTAKHKAFTPDFVKSVLAGNSCPTDARVA